MNFCSPPLTGISTLQNPIFFLQLKYILFWGGNKCLRGALHQLLFSDFAIGFRCDSDLDLSLNTQNFPVILSVDKSNQIVFVTCAVYNRCSRPYSEVLTYKPLTNNAVLRRSLKKVRDQNNK